MTPSVHAAVDEFGRVPQLLSVRGLRVRFQTRAGVLPAVAEVSFDLGRGEALALVGESGSGKSVTALAILGLLPTPPAEVTAERLCFDGEDLLTLSPARLRALRGDRIAMIFQDPMTALNPFLTIGRQLTEVLTVHRGLSEREARREAQELLALTGIADPGVRLRQYAHQLSGGMRQRVLVAMALLCRPDLLIADEPTTALDATLQAQILALIQDLRQSFGTALLLITHDLGVVAGVASRVAVMYAGRLCEMAPTAALFERPRHPYTRGLLASLPRLDRPRGEPLLPIPGQPPELGALPSGCAFRTRCPLAEPRCAAAQPELRRVGDSEVACWVAE